MTVDKPKRKVRKLSEFKKPIVVGSGIAVIAIAGILTGLFFINISNGDDDSPEVGMIYCYKGLPYSLDPVGVQYDTETYLVSLIAEGLFIYNYSNNDPKIIPGLATHSDWSDDWLNLTCTLRQRVEFHDQTPFNAAAVKWNYDRLYRLINHTYYPFLWLLPDGRPIINETQIINDYTVRFVLNAPYAPFKSLLTSFSACILSPSATPANEFLDIATERTIGTGPFKFENFNVGENFTLLANQNYWGVEPEIDKLTVLGKYFGPAMDALNLGQIDAIRFRPALLDYELDAALNSSFYTYQESMMADFRWITMNNNRINSTMRKAISYAFNYSALEPMEWSAVRAVSPIPEEVLYHNITGINAPYYNISTARQTLIEVGWNGTTGLLANDDISSGNPWETIANSSFPIATYNYTYISWLPSLHPMIYLSHVLSENLMQIGVKINLVGVSWNQHWAMIEEMHGYHRNMYDMTYVWWGADYNDPFNFVNLMFTNKRVALNAGQVNDTMTQIWLDQATGEFNTTLRRELYYNIQKRLIEEVYPFVVAFSSKLTDIYRTNITGWYSNFFTMPFKTIRFN